MLWRASYHCFCFGLRMHCTRAFFCIHCTLAVASNGAALYPHSYNRRKKVQQTGMMKFDACKRRLQHLASEQLCANSFSQNHQTRSGKRYFPLVFIAVFYRCSGVGGEVQCRTEICEWRKNGTVGQDKQEIWFLSNRRYTANHPQWWSSPTSKPVDISRPFQCLGDASGMIFAGFVRFRSGHIAVCYMATRSQNPVPDRWTSQPRLSSEAWRSCRKRPSGTIWSTDFPKWLV